MGRTGGGDVDGGYEGKLVEEICAAGGTKSTPGKVLVCTTRMCRPHVRSYMFPLAWLKTCVEA